ncbi:MAG: Efflux transporter periplasmic adaptor subunit [Acidobacteriota bacterium]|nr:Efflux transporter periplasmic adaptor subunit [Acidobacteriota bacterium]
MIKRSFLLAILSINLTVFVFCGMIGAGNNNGPKQTQQADNNHQQGNRNRHRHGQTSLQEQTVIMLSEKEKSRVRIETVTVEEKPIQSTLKAMGKVLAPIDGKAIVGYAFPGRVIKLKVSLGQWVKSGSPLVTLECEATGNARSEYLKAFTEFQLAQQNFEREERLFSKDIGAKKDFLQTKAQLEIAGSNLEAAEKKLMVMGFPGTQIQEFSKAKNITPYVTINAPIDGRVIRIDAVPGSMIEPATEIMILLDPSRLCIDAEIYEKDLAKIKLHQEVQIAVPAYPSETFSGRISYIGDIVHPETRTITVRTLVPNKDFKLKPGMFADIDIRLERREKALTVPIEAVLDNLDQKIVFTREADSFICKAVEIGPAFNGYIEIKKGLRVGEAVVVEGNYQLKSKLYEQTLHQAHVH